MPPSRRRNVRLPRRPGCRRTPRGFALIEALIAILIFSLASLGLLGLQVTMMQAQGNAKYRAEAAYLANDLIGTMWADYPNLASYDGGSCASYTPCQRWQDRLSARLPAGAASAAVDATTNTVTLRIRWQPPNDGEHQFSTVTSIIPNTLP